MSAQRDHARLVARERGVIALRCQVCGEESVLGVEPSWHGIAHQATVFSGNHHDCADVPGGKIRPPAPAPLQGTQQPAGDVRAPMRLVDLKAEAKARQKRRQDFDSKLVELFGVDQSDLED